VAPNERRDCLFGWVCERSDIGRPDPTQVVGRTHYDRRAPTTAASARPLERRLVQAAVDPIELEPIIGWDANLNGNLAELLQRPNADGS